MQARNQLFTVISGLILHMVELRNRPFYRLKNGSVFWLATI